MPSAVVIKPEYRWEGHQLLPTRPSDPPVASIAG